MNHRRAGARPVGEVVLVRRVVAVLALALLALAVGCLGDSSSPPIEEDAQGAADDNASRDPAAVNLSVRGRLVDAGLAFTVEVAEPTTCRIESEVATEYGNGTTPAALVLARADDRAMLEVTFSNTGVHVADRRVRATDVVDGPTRIGSETVYEDVEVEDRVALYVAGTVFQSSGDHDAVGLSVDCQAPANVTRALAARQLLAVAPADHEQGAGAELLGTSANVRDGVVAELEAPEVLFRGTVFSPAPVAVGGANTAATHVLVDHPDGSERFTRLPDPGLDPPIGLEGGPGRWSVTVDQASLFAPVLTLLAGEDHGSVENALAALLDASRPAPG